MKIDELKVQVDEAGLKSDVSSSGSSLISLAGCWFSCVKCSSSCSDTDCSSGCTSSDCSSCTTCSKGSSKT